MIIANSTLRHHLYTLHILDVILTSYKMNDVICIKENNVIFVELETERHLSSEVRSYVQHTDQPSNYNLEVVPISID